jgi:hypothetical protein
MSFFEMIFGESDPKGREARRERRRLSREARMRRIQTRVNAAQYGAKNPQTIEKGITKTLRRWFGG